MQNNHITYSQLKNINLNYFKFYGVDCVGATHTGNGIIYLLPHGPGGYGYDSRNIGCGDHNFFNGDSKFDNVNLYIEGHYDE